MELTLDTEASYSRFLGAGIFSVTAKSIEINGQHDKEWARVSVESLDGRSAKLFFGKEQLRLAAIALGFQGRFNAKDICNGNSFKIILKQVTKKDKGNPNVTYENIEVVKIEPDLNNTSPY